MTYKYGFDSSAETSDEEIDYMKNLSVDNFDCNLCDFKGKTTGGLKTHKKRKHKDKQKFCDKAQYQERMKNYSC